MIKLRISLISRSRFAREGIADFLAKDQRLSACSHHDSLSSALPELIKYKPDVVVVAHEGANTGNAISSLRVIRQDISLVVSGLSLNQDIIISYAKSGVSGYIRDEATGNEWAEAICGSISGNITDSAIAGILNRYIASSAGSPEVSCHEDTRLDSWSVPKNIEESASRVGITRREQQILKLVDQGLSSKHIARKLDVSPNTVKTHISSILSKYNVHRRSEAAALYRQNRDHSEVSLDLPTPKKYYS